MLGVFINIMKVIIELNDKSILHDVARFNATFSCGIFHVLRLFLLLEPTEELSI